MAAQNIIIINVRGRPTALSHRRCEMNLAPPKVCLRIHALFNMLGSSNANEATNARDKLIKLLAKHGLTWNDLPTISAAAIAHLASKNKSNVAGSAASSSTDAPEVNVLDLILHLLELYIGLTPEQQMAVALWALHCYVFDSFEFTPRLCVLSPVRSCGKTSLFVLLELLIDNADRSDNVTAAAIYHLLDSRTHTTLLLDEGDNLGLLDNNVLRAVFNAGHRRGGAIRRFVGGWSKRFDLFAPLAVAAIGILPLPLMDRSVQIHMRRRAPSDPPLQRLNELDPVFPRVREQIRKWAATCSLAREPEMPPQLHGRQGDNWRTLISIADDLGHGEAARAAAIALCAGRIDEDPGVVLLIDIRNIFDAFGVDRISSKALVAALVAIEDGLWHDWRGMRDDLPPHKLNQSELARLLKPFGIWPRTVWPAQRLPGSKSNSGYRRSQFEASWGAYCPPAADTPTQSRRIISLPQP
jgi:hypothetical protein